MNLVSNITINLLGYYNTGKEEIKLKCIRCSCDINSNDKHYEIDVYRFNFGTNLNYLEEVILCKDCFENIKKQIKNYSSSKEKKLIGASGKEEIVLEDKKFYNFEDTMRGLNFAYFLRNEYPFCRGDLENIKAGWGMIIVPRKGIEETIEVALSGKDKPSPLSELVMMYQLPFEYNGGLGMISKNISLSFRYDKEFKYGEINKNIAECCYAIQKWGRRTNDFYIIEGDYLFDFMSYYVFDNQYGFGCEELTTFVTKDLSCLKDDIKEIVL